jgi:hypothetical protein
MLGPHNKAYQPGDAYRKGIAEYFKLIIGGNVARPELKAALPKVMPTWDKIRMEGGRVTIRSRMVTLRTDEQYRISLFVRVSRLPLWMHQC